MNKKSILAAAAILMGVIPAFGQGIMLKQDFEGATFPPEGWSMIDNDGDGHCWQTCGDSKWVNQASASSKLAAVSFTVNIDTPSLTPYAAQDNWLVSPLIEVKNDAYVLEFVYAAQNVMTAEPLEVLISETGGSAVGDFKSIDKLTAPADEDDVIFQTYTKPLTSYTGKTIRVAIRHKATATYGLSVDDFYIYDYNGPLPPTFTSITAAKDGSASATLGWTNPLNSKNGKPLTELRINVYRDGVKTATVSNGVVPGESMTWTDNTVAVGNTYVYHISAENANGESPLYSKKGTVTIGPDVPAKVGKVVAALSDGTVNLQWDAVTAGANKGNFDPLKVTYNVYRVSGNGQPSKVAEGLNSTRWAEKAPAAGTYLYYVTASNTGGESVKGDISKITVFDSSLADMAVAGITTVESSLNRLPDLNSQYSLYQTIFTPADLNYVTGDIKKIVFKSSSYNGTGALPAKIYISPTSLDEFSATDKEWAAVAASDLVFDGTVTLDGGEDSSGVNDVTLDLTTPYNYTGGNFVLTYIKNDKPNGAFADRYLTADLKGALKTFTTSTYNEIDINNLPHSTYSDKVVSEVPSIRFIVETSEMAALSGKVVNAADNRAVANALITVAGVEGMTGNTDADGNFNFRFIPVKATALNISATGYVDATVPLSLQEGAATTVEVRMTENENYTIKGKLTTDDTGKPAAGARVAIGGYATAETTADGNGEFTIPHIYSGKDYTLSVIYPTYDIYETTLNNVTTVEVDLGTITLNRSLIPPFALDSKIAEDGSAAALSWRLPTDRDVEKGWKAIGDPSEFNYTGGSYYSAKFNIGHYFSEENLVALKMAGLSVDSIRLYVKKQPGNIYAKVWKGSRNDNVEIASQQIPDELLPAEGGWVTVKLDNPVELREGQDYIIGATADLAESSSDVFGQAKGSYISGANNLKWSDYVYDYDGYNTWCIMAYCNVPGTEADIVGNADAPDCDYNVYRKESKDTDWTKLNTSPVRTPEFSDNTWANIPAGEYTYAVTAIYKKGESEKAVSMPVKRNVDTDAGIVAFVSPVKSTEVRGKVSVEVMIANFGELPINSIPVKATLNGGNEISTIHTGELKKGETAVVSVGEFELSEGVHTIVAATALTGDQSEANDELSMLLPNMTNVDIMAYRWDAYGNSGYMRVPSNNPEGAQYLAEVIYDDALLIAAENVNGKVYAFTATWYGEPRGMVTINPSTWLVDKHFPNADDIYEYVIDMTYDGKNGIMYALMVSDEPDYVDLVKVNMETAATTYVGSINKICRTLAADMEGHLYMIANDGVLYLVNPETAAVTKVGDTGVGTASYLQSMAFDHNTNRLFWAHTSETANGDVYEVDPATGDVIKLGTTLMRNSEGCELLGLYTPYEYPEITEDNPTGTATVASGNLSLSLDAEGMLTVACDEPTEISIFNANGYKVYSAMTEAGVSRRQLNLTSGIYVVKCNDITIKALIK